ncbi:MAG: hypothetical protein C5B58_12180 [Acidobacteria bacterium]|nr:MAG: hypothetical protein C5B58_12180 [Acidobacteriota bacterium]
MGHWVTPVVLFRFVALGYDPPTRLLAYRVGTREDEMISSEEVHNGSLLKRRAVRTLALLVTLVFVRHRCWTEQGSIDYRRAECCAT